MAQNPQFTAPLLNQFQYTYEKDSVTIFGQALIAGDLGVVSSFSGLGIQSISKTSAPTHASFTGQVPGMTTDITLTANNAGSNDNGDELTGDGTSTINQLVAAYNIANPTFQMTLTAGNGAQIPNVDETIDLAGGTDGSVGAYNVVLLDVFNKLMEYNGQPVAPAPGAVEHIQLTLSPAASQANVSNLLSKTLVMQCINLSGDAVNPDDGTLLMFRVVLRNSSLNAPTG